jgi:OTU domain-containing protein 6
VQEKESELKSEPRVSKAQKKRDKKASKDKEREIQIAQQEEINKFGPRNIEEVRIKQLLSQRKLRLHEVPSDGNWLVIQ